MHFWIGMGCVAGSLLLGICAAHAQAVPVSIGGFPNNATISAGGANYCLAVEGDSSKSGSNVPAGNAVDPNPVGVLVAPDGNNYGIRGNYIAIPPDCASLPDSNQAICQSFSIAFTGAVERPTLKTVSPRESWPRQGLDMRGILFLCNLVQAFAARETGVPLRCAKTR